MKKSAKKVIDGDSLESEKKENDKKIDTQVNDGNHDEKDSIKRDDSVTYTLDKAMDELSIETNDSRNDQEMSSGHAGKVTDTETTNNSVDDVVIEKTTVKETIKHNVKNSSESKSSKRHKEVGPSKSKTDYLMQLLDKRKALLSKMADIQNEENNVSAVTKHGEGSDIISDKIDSMETTKGDIECDNIGDKTKTVEKRAENNTNKKEKVDIIEIPESSATKPKEDALPRHEEHSEIKTSEKSYCKSKVEKKKGKSFVNDIACDNQKKTKSLSVLDLISRGVRSWITDKTIAYLKVDDDNDGDIDETKSANSVFQKQYKALVAKVDAQEKDFDGLLGEETMDSDFTDKPSAPLPHFEVLREELEEDQIRVREFMKGSFTYKVQEKQTFKKDDGSDKVVLPTVDRYDQMLIRQKIVLDRINRILPDILPPLHLLVQDICTELKELIYTFNLTSNNILFKPAEWTIITLILLRMLSRKMVTVQRSFTSPGAEKYFIVMLSSIGGSIEQVDVVVNKLLTFEQPRDV
ncbi:putative RNA polymerase II subunit B1 CTD phosphatase RPAP2 [Ruditapes philippinarum]|uniref:putative RNA polymerase II subunit B1 CTD phosphatase RPAP2 n=1 Tax=Ruditapes philippinarum TaxID=129788 RepID=UPI00295AB560|nr:putative RNA polymerase II subunit B1 CTD phosphatase RPAP2 [Ruditapes philippinarum]